VTSVGLAHCILGKFLGVVCHCFPPHIYIYIKISGFGNLPLVFAFMHVGDCKIIISFKDITMLSYISR